MGKEQRAKEERIALGKYNVHAEIDYGGKDKLHIDAESWDHVNQWLALQISRSELKIFNMNLCRSVTLTPQEPKLVLSSEDTTVQ